MDDAAIKHLLQSVNRIAVVGLSPDTTRPSHGVGRALQGFGYEVIPVNPKYEKILGETSYPDLASMPQPIDLVDVFRASEHVSAIVDDCLALGLAALWLQEGVVDEAATGRAREAGMDVVMDRCIYKEYRRLMQ